MENKDAQHQQEAGPHDGGGDAQSGVRQEGGNSAEGSKGVQQGRSGEAEAAAPAREVACAYAVTVDGFISIPLRAIRNLESPLVVWMSHASWQKLAICATTQGQFYIPCRQGLQSPDELRLLVKQKEHEHG